MKMSKCFTSAEAEKISTRVMVYETEFDIVLKRNLKDVVIITIDDSYNNAIQLLKSDGWTDNYNDVLQHAYYLSSIMTNFYMFDLVEDTCESIIDHLYKLDKSIQKEQYDGIYNQEENI